MGAWRFMLPPPARPGVRAGPRTVTLGYVGRAESASPATGFHKTHELSRRSIDRAKHCHPRTARMAVELKVPAAGRVHHRGGGRQVAQEGRRRGDGDEPVVVLETDKVTIDVPAPAAGAIAAIALKEGDKVKIGDVLGTHRRGRQRRRRGAKPAAAAPAPAQRRRRRPCLRAAPAPARRPRHRRRRAPGSDDARGASDRRRERARPRDAPAEAARPDG